MITTDQRPTRGHRGWRHESIDGIRVHWAPVAYSNDMGYRSRIAAFFSFAIRAAMKASRLNVDVVFATSTPLTIALPGVWSAWRLGVPMVFEVRDLWPDVPIAIGALRNPVTAAAARWLQHFAYRNSSRIVALAPGMKRAIVESGYPEQKVIVIPNGSDLDTFDPSGDAGERIRDGYEWLGQRRMVLFFGTLGLVNGVDYLIRLAAEVRRLDPDVRFVVLGDGRMEPELRELARDLGVLDENLFILGKVSKARVAEWLAASDMSIALFTGPRVVWKDATQNKFFDSLAAGRPIANNFDGWQSRIAEEAGCGLILDADSIGVAANQLYARLTDPAWLDTARRRARELAERRFNRDDQARQLERVLQEALAENVRTNGTHSE
jgi:glycosyltransferase involved in cell wall biosynthesis